MTHYPRGQRTLIWRPLGDADLPALTDLAGRCLAFDGGQPFAADAAFVRTSYLTAGDAIGGFDGTTLISAAAIRPAGGAVPLVVTSGMVAPDRRRLGIGGRALDWALAKAGPATVRAETEVLSAGAEVLYPARGLSPVFAEYVMQLPTERPWPTVSAPPGMTLTEWSAADPDRFFAVYEAAFRERPGFPFWSAAQWIEWISLDEDFRADWTLLASRDGADVGFIAGESGGWIAQVGVVRQARGQAVGASLVAEVIRRMRTVGLGSVTLNVNLNNPHAAALYERLGFRRIGRRAKYQQML